MKLPHTLLVACILLIPSGTLYGLDGWMTDMEQAKLRAVEQEKDLFIVYKGASWSPEQYGTPESMFTCDSVKKHLGFQFVLVMQDYPPGYQEGYSPFSFSIREASSLSGQQPWSSAPNGELQSKTRYVFATADNIPYHISEQKPTWLQLQGESMEAEKKKPKILNLIRKVHATKGEEKYRLMGKLFKLTEWPANLPATLYPQLHKEALLNDRNNVSDVCTKDNNYPRILRELAWGAVCTAKSLELLASSEEDLPENIKSTLSPNWVQAWHFSRLFYTLAKPIMEKGELGTLEDFLETAEKKTDQIISLAPHSKFAWMMQRKRKALFPEIYHFISVARLSAQPDKILEMLPDIVKQPWNDEETTQLFGFVEAACYLKKGNLDKGLDLLKTYRAIAPWTGNAQHADASIHSITARLASLRELWKKKQAGDEESAKEYQESITLYLSLEANL